MVQAEACMVMNNFESRCMLLISLQQAYCICFLLSVCILSLDILCKGLWMLDHTLLHGLERCHTV